MFGVAIFVAILTVAVHAHEDSTVLTYNTLLFPQLQNGEVENRTELSERVDEIVYAIKKIDADFVCLQEVWIAEDVEKIIDDLNSVYKYSYSLLHQTGEVPSKPGVNINAACPAESFVNYTTCMIANTCANINLTVMFTCMYLECKAEYFALPQKCVSCMSIMGLHDQIGMIAKCTGEPAVNKTNMNEPGLLILSRNEFDSVEFVDYQPNVTTTYRRGYLTANVQGMGQVTCTHLSAIMEPYTELHLLDAGTFTNFEDQNLDEINQLVEYVTVDMKTSPHIILGDFNTGPFDAGLSFPGEFPDNYKVLKNRMQTTLVDECTFCYDNLRVNGAWLDMAIDHVFYWEHEQLEVERVIDMYYLANLPLSDHYGVLGRLRLSKDVNSAPVNIASLLLMLVSSIAVYFLQ